MKLFSCMSCIREGEGKTSFTIKSKCFEKPITFHLENDDAKFEMLHDLIWTLIGDDEQQKEKLKRNMSKKTVVPLKKNTVIAVV